MHDKRSLIMETATWMIQSGGYNAFSFREIADRIGIKSSSVHHYFRRKEDLAVAVASQYTEDFFKALGSPDNPDADSTIKVRHYCDTYIKSFKKSGKACLCGILSHESPALPRSVVQEITKFTEANIRWLGTALVSRGSPDDTSRSATFIYCALQGAMALATLKNNVSYLRKVKMSILEGA